MYHFPNFLKALILPVPLHFASTESQTDKVIVLKDGHVAEEGRHEDLVDDVHSVYREMWNKQENSEVFLATTFEDRPNNDAAPAA